MRKAVFAIVFLLAAAGIKAQELQQDYMSISVTHFFESTYLLGFEHFNKNLDRSIHASAGLIARGGNDRTKIGGMVSLQRRYYFIAPDIHAQSLEDKKFDQGFYFAPYGTFKYIHAKSNQYIRDPMTGETDTVKQSIKSNSVEGGLLMGFQFNVAGVVYIDTYFGGGIHYAGDIQEHIWDFGIYPITYNGVVVKAGIAVGIKF